jgi:hypothetical protein
MLRWHPACLALSQLRGSASPALRDRTANAVVPCLWCPEFCCSQTLYFLLPMQPESDSHAELALHPEIQKAPATDANSRSRAVMMRSQSDA